MTLISQLPSPAGLASGESVLEGVGDQFVQDQSAGNGDIQPHIHSGRLHREADIAFRSELGAYMGAHRLDIVLQIDMGQVFRFVETLMHQGHGADPAFQFPQQTD